MQYSSMPIGSSENSIKKDFKITWNDKDVTKNYDIQYKFGTLTVLNASDTTYIKGSKTDLTLHLDVDYSDFRDLLMDGEVIGSDNYSSGAGSTVVTLKGSYLETLKVFLEENMSYPAAAKRLYIHRSTLIDRIARIERIG